MPVAEVEIMELGPWAGGVNLVAPAFERQPDELTLALNADLTPEGLLQLRKGAVPITHASHAHSWVWVKAFKPSTETDWGLVLVTEDNMHSTNRARMEWSFDENLTTFYDNATITNNGDLWGDGTGYGFWPQAVVINDRMYLTRAGSNSVTYEIKSPAGTPDVDQIVRWTGVANVTDKFPSAVALTVAYERVFAANICAGATSARTFKDRLFFSDPLLPMTWNAASYIDIGPDENTEITALMFFGDQIIVFKESSIWAVAGSDFTSIAGIQVYKISDGIGCTAPMSVVNTGTEVIWLDHNRGFFSYDGSSVTNIGLKVFDAVKASFTAEAVASQINAWIQGDSYHVSFVDAQTYVFNLNLRAWTSHNWNLRKVTSWVDEGETFYRGVSASLDAVADMYVGYENTDGSAVQFDVEFVWARGESLLNTLRVKWFEVELRSATREVALQIAAVGEATAEDIWTLPASGTRALRIPGPAQRTYAVLGAMESPPDSSSETPTTELIVTRARYGLTRGPRRRGLILPPD